uniref:ubiquitinyl hydrolase 1 n=1 Tax=Cyprinodon variegatus TaxID=28743 RepID=A0A3Q2CPZ8_CYPVA
MRTLICLVNTEITHFNLFNNWKRKQQQIIYCLGPSCRHIRKGTDQTLLKKLSAVSDWTNCQDCKHEENKENICQTEPEESEEKETVGVWMCLKCGHRGCGRHSENQHAIKHYETPRSDPHCLVVSLDNLSVWCYLCDDEVTYSSTGQLAQLENKDTRNKQRKNIKKENVGKSPTHNTVEENDSVPVKGLSNLGNTCFFNAVLQNLSQTQLLRQILNKITEEKIILDIQPDPSLVPLDQPGSLTLAMCKLLNEIQESKKGVVTPRELFSQVCKNRYVLD